MTPCRSHNLTMKAINVTELKAHLSKYLRMASGGSRIVVNDRHRPIAQLGRRRPTPSRGDSGWPRRLRSGWARKDWLGNLDDTQTAGKRKELTDLLDMLDLVPIDGAVIDRAKSPFAVSVRALDAIHVATAEILVSEAEGEPLEFWTHDDRPVTALSRGLTVRGT